MASEREIQMEHYTSNISVDILVQPQVLFVVGNTLIAPIVGETTTPKHSTLPVVHIGGGWNGPIKLIVSCVTDDPPHKCHPFIIVGQSRRCGYGIYTEYLMNGDEFVVLSDPITSSLQPVSPIIIRSYQEDNSGAASSSAGTSASATRRESRWEWLAKLSSPAARDDTAIASGSSQNLSERTPTKARDSPKKFNLHFYYHKKDRGGSSDSDSD
ncbi:uncharacterized protein LOC109856746 isoform X3 [Pseudomyrmex gracilis]|uniref:uncharacterized protein LOC109856746 isoform X3 n=1 Tax=Pseudomyrmex gracilis TaxID=219809 RepID=UPI0009959536|nr:uncharacterized protein LOC109856746 isoform X3 [Pseudomyrmex gracilis]